MQVADLYDNETIQLGADPMTSLGKRDQYLWTVSVLMAIALHSSLSLFQIPSIRFGPVPNNLAVVF
jgi:hypothetical protein